MLKGKLWINKEWSDILTIISITPVPNIKLKLGDVLIQKNEFNVIYIDQHGDLDLYISSSLTDIKII